MLKQVIVTKLDVLAPPLLFLVQRMDPCLVTPLYGKINDFLLQSMGKTQEAGSSGKGYHRCFLTEEQPLVLTNNHQQLFRQNMDSESISSEMMDLLNHPDTLCVLQGIVMNAVTEKNTGGSLERGSKKELSVEAQSGKVIYFPVYLLA